VRLCAHGDGANGEISWDSRNYYPNPQRFIAEGTRRFRLAHGDSTNFVESVSYSGNSDFPNGLAYLVNFEDRVALPLAPLIFWYGCEQHPNEEHCYFYDIHSKGEPPHRYSYKAASFSCQLSFDGTHPDLSEFFSELTRWYGEDPKIEVINF